MMLNKRNTKQWDTCPIIPFICKSMDMHNLCRERTKLETVLTKEGLVVQACISQNFRGRGRRMLSSRPAWL